MSLLDKLGIDPEDFDWRKLGACRGMDTELFYDQYEKDPITAANVDEICIGCPVASACLSVGQQGEEGVWGGVYLSNGKVDKVRNKHKSRDTWKNVEKATGKNLT
jgi:hypothetical protein